MVAISFLEHTKRAVWIVLSIIKLGIQRRAYEPRKKKETSIAKQNIQRIMSEPQIHQGG